MHKPQATPYFPSLKNVAGSGAGFPFFFSVCFVYWPLQIVVGVTSCDGPRHMSALMVAAETGSLEAVTAVMKALGAVFASAKAIVSVYKCFFRQEISSFRSFAIISIWLPVDAP